MAVAGDRFDCTDAVLLARDTTVSSSVATNLTAKCLLVLTSITLFFSVDKRPEHVSPHSCYRIGSVPFQPTRACFPQRVRIQSFNGGSKSLLLGASLLVILQSTLSRITSCCLISSS